MPGVDGWNLGSARLDVLSSLDMQDIQKSPGGIEAIWTAFIFVQSQPEWFASCPIALCDHLTIKNIL